MRDTAARVALNLAGDAPVVLQRVGRGVTAEDFREALASATGGIIELVEDPFKGQAHGTAVWDGRVAPGPTYDNWDARRHQLETRSTPLVVLLDVASTRDVLRRAPHTASWAGGVWLPAERLVRPARSDPELSEGEKRLAAALRDDPEIGVRFAGETVGIDLATGRVFGPGPARTPLVEALDSLDEGIIYIARLPR